MTLATGCAWVEAVLPLEVTLVEKLRKLGALHAGTKIEGEREAARRAAERIRTRLAEIRGLNVIFPRSETVNFRWISGAIYSVTTDLHPNGLPGRLFATGKLSVLPQLERARRAACSTPGEEARHVEPEAPPSPVHRREVGAILRRHLADQVPISNRCNEIGLQPSLFCHWLRPAFHQLGRHRARHASSGWRAQCSKRNEPERSVSCDHWLGPAEQQAMLDFHGRFPLEGCRRASLRTAAGDKQHFDLYFRSSLHRRERYDRCRN